MIAARYFAVPLNDYLLKGPDMTNASFGVLCRFRLNHIAFSCDVKAMFHQFLVHEKDRDFLRFLWWDKGDTSTSPKTFYMNAHLFGAVSYPGCAHFGPKQLATDYEEQYGTDVANFIREDSYLDDD